MSRDPSLRASSLNNSAKISNTSGAPVVSDAFLDESVDLILRAAGSGLRYYMPSSKKNLREAMRAVLASAREVRS